MHQLSTLQDNREADLTQYLYDTDGNLHIVEYPDVNSVYDTLTYTYDADDNLVKRIDGNSLETDYVRDTAVDDRLTNINYPTEATSDVSYGYDAFNRINAVSNGNAGKSYLFDDLGNPKTATVSFNGGPQNQTITYHYKANGSRYQMITPGGTFNYTYDGLGRMLEAAFPNATFDHQYDTDGRLWTTTGPTATTTYLYDQRNELTSLTNATPGGTVLDSYTGMTYDGVGNRTGTTISSPQFVGTVSYNYLSDADLYGSNKTATSNALTSEAFTATLASPQPSYSFNHDVDEAGNEPPLETPSGGFNADDQLPTSTVTYDGNGNRSGFTYDAENRATTFGSYDGDGLEISSSYVYQNIAIYFVDDGSFPAVEETSDGTVVAVNGMAADGWRSRYSSFSNPSVNETYVFDPQGNVSERLNAAAGGTIDDVLYSLGYGVFYDQNPQATPTDPVGFAGQFGGYTYPKASNYVLMGHRIYDQPNNRFITRDPIGYAGGINLYAYAGDNPINGADPNGLDATDAERALFTNKRDIVSVANQNGIQSKLLAGVVWAEVNAGGAPGWNALSRQLSIQKFAIAGKGDLGMTKFHQFAADHPELHTYAQRLAWAQRRDANDYASLVDSAQLLAHIARRRYGSQSDDLTDAQVAIVLTEYNLGERPIRANAQPNKEGRAFLAAAPTIGVILAGGHDARRLLGGLNHTTNPFQP